VSEVITRQRVGAEFVGLARVFRGLVQHVDQRVHDALVDIAQPLRKRLREHPRLRSEQASGALRLYHLLVPEQCRISIDAARHKTDFMVVEQRLMPSRLRHDDWGDSEPAEPGISICKLYFGTKDGKVIHRVHPRVAVSLHAIARRVERGADRSHDALLADIAILVNADGEDVPTPASDGQWLGNSIIAQDDGKPCRLLNVRTWVNQ
jgi:hypothetical protein